VKIVKLEKFKSQIKLIEFTQTEIRVLSNIEHPNIIRYKETLYTANDLYLVYEYCNGGTLLNKIKKYNRLPER